MDYCPSTFASYKYEYINVTVSSFYFIHLDYTLPQLLYIVHNIL